MDSGGPRSTGSQSGQARGRVHSSQDPSQINKGWGWGHPSPIPKCWTLSPEAGAVGYLMSEEPQVLVLVSLNKTSPPNLQEALPTHSFQSAC